MITEADYYDILTENIADFENILPNATPDQIAKFVERCNPNIDAIPHPINDLHLYRARYADDYDITDPNQFGYIHGGQIKMYRYNRANEAVLYTASDPSIAFREIENNGNSPHYYLSVWQKHTTDMLNGAMILSYLHSPNSNAEKFHDVASKCYEPHKLQYFHSLGYLLENPEGLYELSSQISHKLFSNGIDFLVTTSRKSDGRELNFTFRKDVADKHLQIVSIYECTLGESANPAVPYIGKIGVPTNGKLSWHDWEVVPESITMMNPQPENRIINVDCSLFTEPCNFNQLMPNPQFSHTEEHFGYINIEDIPVFVNFKIRLK